MRVGNCPKEEVRCKSTGGFLWNYPDTCDRNGSNTGRTLLGPDDRDIRPRGEPDFAVVCEVVCAGSEERHAGCRRDL